MLEEAYVSVVEDSKVRKGRIVERGQEAARRRPPWALSGQVPQHKKVNEVSMGQIADFSASVCLIVILAQRLAQLHEAKWRKPTDAYSK